jgi:hypothetical protein
MVLPDSVKSIASKSNALWTREEFYAIKDFVGAVPDAAMTRETIDLLFRMGDVEERLIALSYAEMRP